MAASRDARVIGAFVICAMVWGSTWLVIKGQIGPVPASWSVTWRFAIASVAMFGLCWARGELQLPGRAVLIRAALIGATMFCGNFQFVYRAEGHLTSGLVAVIFAMLMVPNALLARVFLGLHVTRGFLGGSAIALGGIALLMLHEFRAAAVGSDVLLGAVLTLLALLCSAIANVLQASQTVRSVPAMVLMAWGFLIGAVIDGALAWVLAGPPVIGTTPVYLASLAYLALFGSVVTYPLYTLLLREWGPGRAAYNSVVVPIVAMVLSTLFEGYRWSWLNAAGAALSLVGLIVALRSRKPSR
jgi:drug/metabolite transporter (DMT)-like permease